MTKINFRKNILMSGGFRLIIIFFTFLTSWVSTRYLGVELKGKYSYLVTISGFIWIVLDMGLYRSIPYLGRKHPDKLRDLQAWAVWQFVTETVVLTGLGMIFIGYWSKLMGFVFNPLYIILFVGLITFNQFSMQLQSMGLAVDKVYKLSLSQVYHATLMFLALVVGFLFIPHTDRVAYVIISMLGALGFSIIYLTTIFSWKEWIRKIDMGFIRTSYGYGLRVFLSSLFIMLLVKVDIVLIKRMLGFNAVGIYSIAAHIIDLLQLASNLVGGLLLVKLSDTDVDEEKWRVMKKLMMSFFVLLTIANLGFALVGRPLLTIMFGKSFVPVYPVYLILIPASYGLSFGSLFNNYLNSKGFPVVSIILPAIALIVNVLLNLLLIPLWGIHGSALATSVAYTLWFLLIIGYEQHFTKGRMIGQLVPHKADWVEFYHNCRRIAQDGMGYLKRGKKA